MNRKGLTIIDLMIIIAILGLIIALICRGSTPHTCDYCEEHQELLHEYGG